MTTSDPATLDLHEVVAGRLRRAGQRYTTSRRAIVDVIASLGNPVTIGEISEHLPSLPRSSAYRNLVDLEGAGIIRRIPGQDEFARFELAEELTEHHHHLICLSCGKVIDFALPPQAEEGIQRVIQELAETERFSVEEHRLDVLGTCASCRSLQPQRDSAPQ